MAIQKKGALMLTARNSSIHKRNWKARRAMLFGLAMIASFVAVRGEFGPCTFEDEACSCRLGDENSGTCYDLVDVSPSDGETQTCAARFCRRGWTCSCQGRTHLCVMRQRFAMIADDSTQKTGTNISCHEESRNVVDRHVLELGSFFPSLSRRGLLANSCNIFAWWLNGELIGNYGEGNITDESIDDEYRMRANHTLLELRPGDLVAFRFRAASYHCYNSYSSFVVNGTEIDTRSPGVSTHFSRMHTDFWYAPGTNVTFSEDESTAELKDFVPLRTQRLSDNATIVQEEDAWQPPDGTKDNAISNFYFRIQL